MSQAAASGVVPGLAEHRDFFGLPPSLQNNVSSSLHGLVLVETQGVQLLTQPALLIGLILALTTGKHRHWWAVLGGSLLVALGPVIELGDWQIKSYPYLFLYNTAPFFERLWFPYRAISVGLVAVCLVVGARLENRPWLVGVLSIGLLAGQHSVWPVLTHPVGCPKPLMEAGEQGGKLIILPMRVQHDGLIWQTWHKMPTFGGMGESAPLLWPPGYKERMNHPFIKALREACARPDKAQPASAALFIQEGYRWVALRLDILASEQERWGRVVPEAQVQEAISRVVSSTPWKAEGGIVVWELVTGSTQQ
jgi:hypothetical protein